MLHKFFNLGKSAALHAAVFLLLTGLIVFISYQTPLSVHPNKILWLIPTLFLIYLGVFTILKHFRKSPVEKS
jgi:hypothetical protein